MEDVVNTGKLKNSIRDIIPAKDGVIVKSDAIVDRNLRVKGKVISGIYANFWGDVVADEVYIGNMSVVRGKIICKKAVIGKGTRFNEIEAEDSVVLLGKCRGNRVYAGKSIKITEGCEIREIVSQGLIIIDGSSRLHRIEGRKIIAGK